MTEEVETQEEYLAEELAGFKQQLREADGLPGMVSALLQTEYTNDYVCIHTYR
jgi:hypothetical protein